MVSVQSGKMIVGFDIGIFKVVVLVGEVMVDGQLEVVGIGIYLFCGLKKGVVVNIEFIVQLIQCVIDEVQQMVGCCIYLVFVGIVGNYICSFNFYGIVVICDCEVNLVDIEWVLDVVQVVVILVDQWVLYILVQDYVIDNQEGVCELLGMFGVCLEVKVYVVICVVNVLQNIEKCVCCCGFEVDDIIFEQLVLVYLVLIEDEKELGVCLVDIGGGIIDIVIFIEGVICYIVVILIVGDQVINDIVMVLCMLIQYVEEIKICYVCVLVKLVGVGEIIKVFSVGDWLLCELLCQVLVEVVEFCYDELFILVQVELCCSGYEDLILVGIVFIGGILKMEGVVELVEEIFYMLVCFGVLYSVKGFIDVVCNLIYLMGVGLLMYGLQKQFDGMLMFVLGSSYSSDEFKVFVLEWFKCWVQGNF